MKDKFLPVSRVDRSFERSDAEEPEMINLMSSLRSYFVLTHFSQEGIFCTSSIKK